MATKTWNRLSQRLIKTTAIWLLLGAAVADTAGLPLTYCSDQNSGTQNPTNPSIYQSLGNCQSLCKAQYAFAVVQGDNCWCSNFAPGDQLPIGNCNSKCPGYPYEYCGSTDNNLFGYLALSLSPSGTLGPSSPTMTSPSKITTPVTTQSLQTIGGSVVTRTVTLMPSGTSASEQSVPKAKMSSGSIIAIAVAVVVAAIVLLAAIIVGVCCWRRKKPHDYIDDEPTSNLGRNTSVLSKAGLLGTTTSVQNTSESPGQSSVPISEKRNSRLQVYDQRLNPSAFMQHDDGSRSSFVSMQDNRDYTRTLNIRNPDPAD